MSRIVDTIEDPEVAELNFADFADFADKDSAKNTFPYERLPAIFQHAIDDCMRVVGVARDLPCIMVLAAVSAAVGKGLRLQASGFDVRSNLFALASAPSGVGKSTCFGPVMEPLLRIEQKLSERHAQTVASMEAEKDLLEAEAAKLKRGKGDLTENAPRLSEIKSRLMELEQLCRTPQMIVENVTIEALAVLMEHNDESMAMLSPDGSEVISNWLGRYNRTDRTDEGVLLKAWTGEPCRINRLSRQPVSLRQPSLALLLCCTPDEIRNLFGNERFVMGGLLPRFLVCESQSRPKERTEDDIRGWDEEVWSSWSDMISELYDTFYTATDPGYIRTSREAQKVFDDAHNAYCRSFDNRPEGDSFEARRVEQAMRIALCLHASIYGQYCCTEPLSFQTAETAMLLASYFGQTAERIQSAARENRDEEMFMRIEDNMARNGMETHEGPIVPIRELVRRNSMSQDQLLALARRYPDRMEVLISRPKNGAGRPSKVVRLKRQIP